MDTTRIKVAISGFGVLQPSTIELMRPMLDENLQLFADFALADIIGQMLGAQRAFECFFLG